MNLAGLHAENVDAMMRRMALGIGPDHDWGTDNWYRRWMGTQGTRCASCRRFVPMDDPRQFRIDTYRGGQTRVVMTDMRTGVVIHDCTSG